MAAISFDKDSKKLFDEIVNKNGVASGLKQGEKASPKGSKLTQDCIGEMVGLLSDIAKDKSPAVSGYATDVEMGVSGKISYEILIEYINGLAVPTAGATMTPQQALICAIDVERSFVPVCVEIYQSSVMPKKYKDRAKKCAQDLVRKVAVDYRNLCVLMNKEGEPQVLAQKINGIDIMKQIPDNKNLYMVYEYVNNVFATLESSIDGKTALTDDEIAKKNLPKGSLRNVAVKTSNLKQKIAPNKSLGDEYAQIFGGEKLSNKTKKTIGITSSVVGLVAVALVTCAIARSCSSESGKENETEAAAMGEKDTNIGNPSDDYFTTEKAPETNESGEIVSEPEEEPIDTSKPSTDRNQNTGSSDDHKLPFESEITVEKETEEPTEETTVSEETTVKNEGFELGNPADGFEEPEEGIIPNRGNASQEEEEEEPSDRW